MRKLINVSFLFFLLITMSTQLQAQKTLKEFSVLYDMSIEAPDNHMATMLEGSTMEMAFKENMNVTKMSMMRGMMENRTIVDKKAEKGLILVSVPMMGKNMAVELGKEEFKKMAEENQKTGESEIAYAKNKKKTIAGYECYEAMVKPAGSDEVMVLYITEQLDPVAKSKWQESANGLKGFPLSIQVEREGMTMTFEATEVNKEKPSKDLFNMKVPEGYEKMTLEEMQQMGQGGGMGF